jgi:hypothetical protein
MLQEQLIVPLSVLTPHNIRIFLISSLGIRAEEIANAALSKAKTAARGQVSRVRLDYLRYHCHYPLHFSPSVATTPFTTTVTHPYYLY